MLLILLIILYLFDFIDIFLAAFGSKENQDSMTELPGRLQCTGPPRGVESGKQAHHYGSSGDYGYITAVEFRGQEIDKVDIRIEKMVTGYPLNALDDRGQIAGEPRPQQGAKHGTNQAI